MGLGKKTYAEERYRGRIKTWHRAIRRPLLLFVAPIFIGSLVWGISEHNNGAYIAGFVTGLTGASAVMFREYAPAYVENWGRGHRGEDRTNAVLRKLEWAFAGDVDNGHGNYDHVVVGPAGVFLIESKNHQGTVEIENGVPRLRRRHDPRANNSLRGDGAQAVRLSREVHDAIRKRLGTSPWVNALVVYWNPFPAKRLRERNVVYLHGSELKSYLEALPDVLSPEMQLTVFDAVARFDSLQSAEPA